MGFDGFLQVYGGSQGWPFIEETSYKLLIETLLGKQEVAVEKVKVKNLASAKCTIKIN